MTNIVGLAATILAIVSTIVGLIPPNPWTHGQVYQAWFVVMWFTSIAISIGWFVYG